MHVGYSADEYARVRGWINQTLFVVPGTFSEPELHAKLRCGEWMMITTDHSVSILEFFEIDGERAANVLIIGGQIGSSFRELMGVFETVCITLKSMGFAFICGTPRAEFHKYLIHKHGFERAGKDELIKRLT